jgi:hypothetical protein
MENPYRVSGFLYGNKKLPKSSPSPVPHTLKLDTTKDFLATG